MADNLQDWTQEPENTSVGTAGDFAKTVGAGALNVGSNLASTARYFFEQGQSEHGAAISKALQDVLATGAGEITESMNPESKKLLESSLTSGEFWEHPLLGAALKTSGMLPSIAVLAIPGGLMADAVGATMVAAGGGAVLNAGSVIDEFYRKVDAATDEELAAQSPYYKTLLETFPPDEARQRFATKMLGMAPAINAVVGAAAGAVGPAGMAARALAGGTKGAIDAVERGAIRRGLAGATEGALANAAQEGVADVTGQKSALEAGLQKEFDAVQTLNRGLEGGALGGIFGGGIGVAAGRRGTRGVRQPDQPTAAPEVAAAPEATPTNAAPAPQATNGTAGTASKPPENAAVGNPQSAPVRSGRDGAKKTKGQKGAKTGVEVVTAAGPDVAQATAIVDAQPAPVAPKPPEAPAPVAEAQQRIQQAQEAQQPASEPVPAQVTPPTPAPEAPPQVAAAQERLNAPSPEIAPVDTAMNVPEQPASLAEQVRQLIDGNRKAVMLPEGTPRDALAQLPPGMQVVQTERGVFLFNPNLTSPAEIRSLSAKGRENELLGLGPVSKAEAVSRANAGETPVAVTERTPDGTEVRAAAGTEQTAPAQVAAIEQVKTPGNKVAVETPQQVLEGRQQPPRTGRVLKRTDVEQKPIDLNKRARENLKGTETDEQGNKIVKGRNMGPKAVARIDEARAKAEKIVADHPPQDIEAEYLRGGEAKEAVIARARAMIAAADAAGLKIPAQIKLSAKGNQISDIPAIQHLRYAKDLVQAVKSKATGAKSTKAVDQFKAREQAKPEDALSARRSEGEEAMRRDQGNVEERADNVVSREEANADNATGAIDVEKNAVQTKVPGSAKGPLRGVDDGAETRTVKSKTGEATEVEGAKAASEVKSAKDDPKLKALMESMNAKLKKPVSLEIKRAAAATETNPSEAQKKAGNYPKGHFKLHGLDVSLENPRGSIRRGMENGKQWAVKMLHHYGYIKRTEGADGDHIDVYVGPNPKSERVFVVDQLDTRTGNFDEHKVMMGFNDEAAAVDGYVKSFSDGKGRERAGNVTEMNIAEFKDWLKNGNTVEPATMHAMAPGLDQVETGHFRTKERRTSMLTEPASKTILDLDLSHLQGVPLRIAQFLKPRLAELVGDTPVHFVDPQDFADITGRPIGAARGMFVNDDEGPRIYIDAREAKHSQFIAHVVLHEAMHRAVHDAIEANPITKSHIRAMMNQTAEKLAVRPELYEKYEYAFTNEHEFMSEAFSNPGFQNMLAQIKVGDKLAARLNLETTSKFSMWDRLVLEVRNVIERVIGKKLPHTHQMIAAAMRVGEQLFDARRFEMQVNAETSPLPRNYAPEQAHFLMRGAADAVRDYIENPRNQTAENAPKLLKLRTFDNIAQMAQHFWRGVENNPVRKIHEAVEKMRVTGDKIFQGSEPIVRKLVDLRAKHTTEQWDEFTALLHDATTANVHPDVPINDPKNAHLGKDALKGKQAKYRHAALARRFAELPEDLRNAFHETTKHFADTQNAMSLGIINNQILHLMGIKDEALGRRIHEGTLDDADRARLGDMLPVIEEASELSKIEGPYVPLMRRGDFVVRGTYKVDVPPGAKRVASNIVEFNNRKDAIAYAEKHDLSAKIKSVWVDKNTGELYYTDPNSGKQTRVHKQDIDSENRFRVTLQDQHVEFFKTKREAEARAAELKQELGDRIDLKGVAPRKYEPDGRPAADLSGALGRLAKKLEGTPAWKEATQQQRHAMRQALTEASISSLGSTRIQSKSLPRRGVKGYSHDIVQNTYDYALSTSRYLARLEHAPQLEAGIKEMNASIDQDASKNLTYGRQSIANEVLQRVEGNNGFEQGGAFSQVTKRLLAISFIDKLGSPAYSIINATQPGMVTMPWLSGRHGVGRSFSALGKAYSDISATKIVKQAVAETGRRIKGQGRPDDFISDIKRRLESRDERAMVDELVNVGLLDPNAGMEISDLVRDTSGIGGKVDTAISYLEGVTREMPRAIEAINRAATALAAYRLERGRGAAHDKAMQYAKDAVNNTQFNYSPTNAPQIFNHPVAKIALQFKKYGQGMYQLIGMQIGKAIRNAEPGDRAEAVRTLAGIVATHSAVAGVLGLPTEPFKYLLMGANAMGLTGVTWGDVEDKIRVAAADLLGKTGGEVATRGLPRLLNLDLARMGLDSVTSFGEPRSNKENDVKTWLFDSLAGPVVSLGGDWIKGLQLIANGDIEKAAEKLVPIKAASDSLRAYRQFTEGKKSASGRDVMGSYTPTEAAMRTLGFGNAREAEIGAKRSAYYSGSQKFKEERSALIGAWVSAKPSEKSKAFIAINQWNRTVPAEAKIKPSELTQKLKRTEKEKGSLVNGVRATKKDKFILDRTSVYNTGA